MAGCAFYKCDQALVITNSTYTKAANDYAKKCNVILWSNITLSLIEKEIQEYKHENNTELKKELLKSARHFLAEKRFNKAKECYKEATTIKCGDSV